MNVSGLFCCNEFRDCHWNSNCYSDFLTGIHGSLPGRSKNRNWSSFRGWEKEDWGWVPCFSPNKLLYLACFTVKDSTMSKDSPKQIFQWVQRFITKLEYHSKINFAKKRTQCAIGFEMRNNSHNSSSQAFVIVQVASLYSHRLLLCHITTWSRQISSGQRSVRSSKKTAQSSSVKEIRRRTWWRRCWGQDRRSFGTITIDRKH